MVALLTLDFRNLRHSRELLNLLELDLRANATYAGMIERKDRCLRLRYANEFYLDVTPACPDPLSGVDCIVIPDSGVPCWKGTNPIGFARWFESRAAIRAVFAEAVEPLPPHNATITKPPLKFVVQLFKRWRDITYENALSLRPPSCVLTTLAGLNYGGEISVTAAFSRLIRILHNTLPHDAPPAITSPAHPIEELAEVWRDNHLAYHDFRRRLGGLVEAWNEIETSRGISRAATLLREIFGEEPVDRSLREQAAGINSARRDGTLRVAGGSGLLAVTPLERSNHVRPNTFHGAV